MTPSELAERFNEIVEAESLADRIPLAQKLREDVARMLFSPWNPIATAPMDRTPVLTTDGNNVRRCYFHDRALMWLVTGKGSAWGDLGWRPTHWAPCPAMPEAPVLAIAVGGSE